eukprot:gene11597-4840_t
MKRNKSEKLQNGVKKISSLVKFRSKGKEEFKKSAPTISSQAVSKEENEKFQKFFKDFNSKYSESDIKTKQEALFKLMNREELEKQSKEEEEKLDLEVVDLIQEICSPRSINTENKKINYNTALTDAHQLPKLNFGRTKKVDPYEDVDFEITEVESPKEYHIKKDIIKEVITEEKDHIVEKTEADITKLTKSELLFYYSKNGNYDGIKDIIEFDKTLLRICEPDTKLNLMHFSTLNNHFKIVEYLIDKGLDVNSQDKFNRTPLLIACSKGFKDIVHLVLQNGGNLNCRDFYGYTPSQLALRSRKFDIVDDLMLYGVNLNLKNYNGFTSLHLCLQNGDLEVLNYLLDKNVKMNIRNQSDETPLMTGVKNDKLKPVSILLSNSLVDKFCKNQLNQNIFHISCYFGYLKMIKLFLEKFDEKEIKKFMNLVDHRGRTPVHYCSQMNHIDCLELLQKYIENVNTQDRKGDTPLHLSLNYPDIARLLVQMGADKNIKNERNLTPYQMNLKLKDPIDLDWGSRFNITTF